MLTNMLILISTDDHDFFLQSSALFAANNMEVIFVPKDGLKLCESIYTYQPDIVLMDVFMPNLDAIGVVQEIDENPIDKEIIFMTISNFGSPTLEKELMANDISYFFLKPIDTEILVERVVQITKTSIKSPNQSPMTLSTYGSPYQDLEIMVTDIIHQIGVPAHIRGYNYLRDSIILVVNDPPLINSVTKKLYTAVADKNTTTPSRV